MTALAAAAVTDTEVLDATEFEGCVIVRDDHLAALCHPVERVPVPMTRRNLLRHSTLVEQLAEHGAVVPVGFGTVFEDETEVAEALLRPYGGRLRALLDQIGDAVEYKLQGEYDNDRLLAQAAATPEVSRRRSARSLPERIALGEAVAQAIEQLQTIDEDLLVARLEGHALGVRPASVRRQGAVQVAFLVARQHEGVFAEEAARVAADLDGRIQLRLVGPLPAWDFATLDVEAS
jgi:hypothetical protein